MKCIHAADLFCGAGGTSTGLYMAADDLKLSVNLLAVNHWPVAIATHSANHKEALHLCHGLDGVDPRKIVPGGRLNLLVASPECTHHSNARGGRPMSDQSRASAWHVVRWLEALDVRALIVENVREFASWGPLGSNGRPLKSRKGELFQAWLAAIRAIGYSVDYKILNAADYGDPTTRQRLFVLAKKGRGPIVWPEPTHAKDPSRDLLGTRHKWRAAREIIDWTDGGTSIFNRKRSLSPNTIRRIEVGLRKFSGIDLDLKPFLVKLYGTSDVSDIESPVPTVTGGGNHLGVAEPFMLPKEGIRRGNKPRSVEEPAQTVVPHHGLGYIIQPFLLGQQSPAAPRSTEDPVPTVAGSGAIAKVEPFLTANFGEREDQEPRVHSVDNPAPVVTSRGAGNLIQPFIAEYHGGPGGDDRIKPVDDPLPTQTCEPRFGLAQPFMMSAGGPEVAPRSVEDPAHTVLARDHIAIAAPFIAGAGGPSGMGKPQSVEQPLGTIIGENHRAIIMPITHPDAPGADAAARVRSEDEPLHTITGARRGELGVVQSFLVRYNGTSTAQSVDAPIGTLTGNDRYALLVTFSNGERKLLDIRFRMLRPRELARAQGFPDDYKFTGKKEDVVKQIGNAVPVNLAKALCKAALS